ncbi:hypothetical protein N8T08_000557 [Aspergillus melleus]|uniref:Uncharacterized protein n=1 Tax=Aspergillus melleus TaxID=138277 RepID=A0ACC3APU7_9EURO|nr:hypothetical protein N8T08_000557 [Aspergillus melleus]
MNRLDLRSSQSSYGDPRHYSANSFGAPQPPPTKTLVDGYRGDFDNQNAETTRFNPLNPAHPQSSALLNTNDPVAMYLLTETAMGDSKNYEILSLEEVEGLKKEHKFLSGRLDAAKRKLALETKLRDAAMSLSRLYNSKSPRVSDEYDSGGSPKSNRSRRSVLGRSGGSGPLDKSDGELAVSARKCEDLSQEIWNLERRVQQIQKRLLEHTAGILQMTHKGLKKNNNNIPHTPESLSSRNTRDSVDEFDDRSLYKPSDHVHELSGQGPRAMGTANGTEQMPGGLDALHNMERRLEEMSERMRGMILESNPHSDFHSFPPPSNNGGPVNPTAMVEAHLAYIEDGLGALATQPAGVPSSKEGDYETEQKLEEINAQLHHIVSQSGLSRAQPLPPPPQSSNADLTEQLSYLSLGVDNIQQRMEGFLEQKSILTTQIQQQRELNSKSDAQRDAHIADLIEQLAHVKKDLELAEREGEQSRDQLNFTMEQLEAARGQQPEQQMRSIPEEHSVALTSEKESRAQAEAEVSRLQTVLRELEREKETLEDSHKASAQAEAEIVRLQGIIQELQHEKETLADSHEARMHAEAEISRLQGVIQELQHEKEVLAESQEARLHAEAQITRLQGVIQELQREKDIQSDAHEARLRAEAEITRLQSVTQELQHEKEAQEGAQEARLRAEAEIARLQGAMQDLQHEREAQADSHEARLRAEAEVTRLEAHLQQLQSGSDTHEEQLSTVRSQADAETARLQAAIDQLHRDADAKAEEAAETRERAEQRISQLEDTMQQIRSEADARVQEATDKRSQAENEIDRLEASMNQLRADIESQLREATEGRTHAEENAQRLQGELTELEGEVVRVQTELTMAKAELDGAYGSRSQRAANIAANPAIQKEFDELHTRNFELAQELASLKAGKPGHNGNLQHRADTLEKELRETIDDYETMTKASIEFEKERERFEGHIDSLRDRCEQLETQLNEERITWMGIHNPSMGRDGTYETTSTMVLKNEFKKMMRDTRVENMKILKAEHEERRRLETLIRDLKKEQANATGKPGVDQSVTAL